MVAIVAPTDADTAIERLGANGEQARIIGRIDSGRRGCTVHGPARSWGSNEEWTAGYDA
jgi:phosphoribosylaminoimidazole (AIR) synthetase